MFRERRLATVRCQLNQFMRYNFNKFLFLSFVLCLSACKGNDDVPIEQVFLLDETITVNGEERGYIFHLTSMEMKSSVLNSWAISNNCINNAELVEVNDGYIHTRWDNCNNNVTLEYYLTKDGGHSWPGGNPDRPGADDPSTAITANDLMWAL